MHIFYIKSCWDVVEYFSWSNIEQRLRFCYHWRSINTVLVHSRSLNMIQKNYSHLTISFSSYHNLYYFVHVSFIKVVREVVEYLSLRRIEWIFRFCYHWRAIDTSLVRSISLKTINIIGWTKRSFVHPIVNCG